MGAAKKIENLRVHRLSLIMFMLCGEGTNRHCSDHHFILITFDLCRRKGKLIKDCINKSFYQARTLYVFVFAFVLSSSSFPSSVILGIDHLSCTYVLHKEAECVDRAYLH